MRPGRGGNGMTRTTVVVESWVGASKSKFKRRKYFLENDLVGVLVKSLCLVGKVNDGEKILFDDLQVREICDLVCRMQEVERRLELVTVGRCPDGMERCEVFERCKDCWEEFFETSGMSEK